MIFKITVLSAGELRYIFADDKNQLSEVKMITDQDWEYFHTETLILPKGYKLQSVDYRSSSGCHWRRIITRVKQCKKPFYHCEKFDSRDMWNGSLNSKEILRDTLRLPHIKKKA